MIFFDYTIPAGGRYSRREHDSATLEPDAVAIFTDMLRTGGAHFLKQIAPLPGYRLRWTSEDAGAAVATFEHHNIPITTSALLAADLERVIELKVIRVVQELIVHLYHDTGMEPGFDILNIEDRPVILSAILPSAGAAGPDAVGMIADMETCLAAAFFAG